MKFFLIGIAFSVMSITPVFSQKSKPNFIIFLVDDMGWQDTEVPFDDQVTAFNNIYRTPNMRKLAERGMKFTNAYANPVCTPTRISIMTGMNVARHMVTNWTSVYRNTPTDYPDSLLTPPQWNYNGLSPEKGIDHSVLATPLPDILKKNGYFTLHCGKAHFAPFGTPSSSPTALGFEKSIGGGPAGHPGSYLGSKNFREHPKDTLWAVPDLDKYHGSDVFLTEALTREALQTLGQNATSKKPFFLYLAHYAVHLPFDKDQRFFPYYFEKGLVETEAKYAALLEGMDKSLGDIMDFLIENNLDQNTYIFFVSDNGGLSLTPQRGGSSHTQNLPLRQGKGSLYEGGIRVPMIVSGPGIEKNSVSNQPIGIEDLFPTVLKLAAIKNQKLIQTIDGKSMIPFLQNKNRIDYSRKLLWHYPNNWTNINLHGISWSSAVRKGTWKLIYFHKTRQLELYNLNNDQEENHDLAVAFSDRTKALANLLTHELRKRGAQMPIFNSSGKSIPWPNEVVAGNH